MCKGCVISFILRTLVVKEIYTKYLQSNFMHFTKHQNSSHFTYTYISTSFILLIYPLHSYYIYILFIHTTYKSSSFILLIYPLHLYYISSSFVLYILFLYRYIYITSSFILLPYPLHLYVYILFTLIYNTSNYHSITCSYL